ncbi:MAG: amidohydrolase family protein [Bryobacteraceae bacterium]
MKTLLVLAAALPLSAQVAVRGGIVHTMAGEPIRDGVVLTRDGRIERVGPASSVAIPAGYRTLQAKVVTPGLVDAHSVVGLTGYLNQPHDQDQTERSTAIQPELRAIDAYNPREPLVGYLRTYGITTVHTGHGPGPLVSGQTLIAKTAGDTVEQVLVADGVMVAATYGEAAVESGSKSPGSRPKMIAMLRAELIRAQEAVAKGTGTSAARDLRQEIFQQLIRRETPLLVTVNRAHDIATVLRLGKEFNLRIVLDGAAEAHLLIDEIKASGYPVILHPTMARAGEETENLSMETASKLKAAGILFALQSGYEGYVPKTRVVLLEAAMAAANGLTFRDALASVTIDAARLLGIDRRVGSIEPGKDADLALYDGDPFEFTTHCTAVVLGGRVVSETPR